MPRREQSKRIAMPQTAATTLARELYKSTSKDRRFVKRLRKLGASNHEIAKALGIPEDAPVLHE